MAYFPATAGAIMCRSPPARGGEPAEAGTELSPGSVHNYELWGGLGKARLGNHCQPVSSKSQGQSRHQACQGQ